ncbi:MAG: hypothetical protein AB7U38_06505, partial [Hyphomicrobiales bacterium]
MQLAGCAISHLSNPFGGSSGKVEKTRWRSNVAEDRLLDSARNEGEGPIDGSVARQTGPPNHI